ncbi:hypothetical protein IWW55_006938, partial [Coemansia sp. RSA 2706]
RPRRASASRARQDPRRQRRARKRRDRAAAGLSRALAVARARRRARAAAQHVYREPRAPRIAQRYGVAGGQLRRGRGGHAHDVHVAGAAPVAGQRRAPGGRRRRLPPRRSPAGRRRQPGRLALAPL